MKKITLAGCIALLGLIACNNESATADKKPVTDSLTSASKDTSASSAATGEAMPDSATMMKNWEAYMTPGEAHTMMAGWAGNWTGDISMWMAPDAPPSKSVGTAVYKMAMGGRYMTTANKGSFNGMPFEGMSWIAYDNAKKVFESTWIDNMGTGIMHLQGPWDAASKTMTLSGKMIDPTTGKETTVKETLRIIDDNTQVMEMYAPLPDGKEFKTMEIKYTRKK